MARNITPKVKSLLEQGYRPWGLVIPGAQNAPEGSAVYQFRRGRDEAAVVLDKAGNFVRGLITLKNGNPVEM